MKKLMLGLAILGALALGSGPVRAQCVPYLLQSAPGPYYATPSWDQKFSATERFLCLSDWNNEAVLDRETGLVWQRSPDSTKQDDVWVNATFGCHNLGSGGSTFGGTLPAGNRLGWRLPSVEELASLVDPTQNNPALPPGHPFQGIQNDKYWTATTDEGTATQAYTVDFTTPDSLVGRIFATLKTGQHLYWCVRGGASISNPPY